jgi:hypothetical protein
MALNMDAAVKIRASVDGLAEITSLNKALGGTEKQAKETSGALGKLRAATSGLSGALGGLVPAVGIAGLAALGKRSIDAADNLNDLSQRTGVGVESLSKFGAAAADSGSSIEEVSKAMGRLSKGIADPASKTNEALKSIGISSTDAQGKIRGVDQIMLDLADRFSKMPDGAQKTALAMELFGKSGMNLIPMLNQGRDALGQYSATIDTQMAQAADKFNDALNAIARSVAGPFNQAITALLPFITQVAQGIAGLSQWFAGLPAPLQNIVAIMGGLTAAFIVLAPAITALVSVLTLVGPLFTGIAAALVSIPALIAGWAGAIAPLMAALAPLGQLLLAIFSGPVGWVALLVAAGVAVYAFRDQIAQAFAAIGQVLQQAAAGFKIVFIDPVANALKAMVDGIKSLFSGLAQALAAPFTAAANMIKGVVNGIIGGIERGINGAISALNRMIAGANAALSRLGLPTIPTLPTVTLPRFAEGGVVNGPTVAMVGEGGEPEYIVPQSKAAGFAANWMAGRRGAAAIPRFAEGGVVMPSTAQVSIQTGPVTQMNGTNYVTTQDLGQAVQFGVQQTLDLIRNDIGVRSALGMG